MPHSQGYLAPGNKHATDKIAAELCIHAFYLAMNMACGVHVHFQVSALIALKLPVQLNKFKVSFTVAKQESLLQLSTPVMNLLVFLCFAVAGRGELWDLESYHLQ